MYTGLEGNVMCFWLTLLEALVSSMAYSRRPIRLVWEKILHALPHEIRVQIIHLLIVSKERAITQYACTWKPFHRATFKHVMKELDNFTLGVYLVLEPRVELGKAVYFRFDYNWGICIAPDVCKGTHIHAFVGNLCSTVQMHARTIIID